MSKDAPAEEAPDGPPHKFQFTLLLHFMLVFAGGALMGLNFWLFDYTEKMLAHDPNGKMRSAVETGRAFGIAISVALLILTGFVTQWYLWRARKNQSDPPSSGVH